MNILGLDRFTRGKATEGLARSTKAANPFDLGIRRNCVDFWTVGRELGVEYETLYNVPPEGFRAARERRDASEEDLHVNGGGGRRKNKGLLGMGLGRSSSGGRDGYQPIRMDDQV
jgi:hypothetical protein